MNTQDDNPIQTSKPGFSIGWAVAVLLVIVAWAGAYAWRGGDEKVVIPGWADGMPAGMQASQESDKPMALLFTAGWCPPCKSLKRGPLAQREVDEALRADYVPVLIDLTDQSPSNPNMAVAMRYEIEFLPTVVITTPEGEPIERHVGERAGPWFRRLAE